MPKELYRSWRIRPKYLIGFGNGAKRLKAYTEITAILELFYFYKVVSEYGKSILAYTENTLKAFKRIWRVRQDCFAYMDYGEYAERHKTEPTFANFFTKTLKNSDLKSPFYT
jgi:hypothetical protein